YLFCFLFLVMELIIAVMFDASHIQSMSGYFGKSDQFYYVTIDSKGNFIYVNPLFQKIFTHIAPDFYGTRAAGIFANADKEKYDQAVRHCIENHPEIVSVDLKIKLHENSAVAIRWELTAYMNERDLDCIQGI